jgi:enoyl-CoA hydratase/carnithine racemase
MDFSHYQRLLFERNGRLLTITLNRPEALNSTDELLHSELARVFIDCATDPDSDVIILTGAGRAFSAGGGHEAMQKTIDEPERFERLAVEAKRIVYSMLDCSKPIIAKVNGHAIGFGATLALFCDVIFAADHAKIGDPHVKVGYVAGDGGAVIWPQLLGFARAKEYLLTGDLLLAAEAAKIGLINHAVPAAQLDQAVADFAAKLLANPSRAVRWTKLAINVGLKPIAHTVLEASMGYEHLSVLTADHREAVAALREQRPPRFSGR